MIIFSLKMWLNQKINSERQFFFYYYFFFCEKKTKKKKKKKLKKNFAKIHKVNKDDK